MYTVVENARIVIALLKAHNIRHIVLSPGGSNIPIVQGVQDDPFFKCYSVVDERSAMYVAIGLYLQTGEIIATSCTSAQATRNYLPGLTEAFYRHVPILAITMSKHPKYVGQEYMQCPVQTSLPIDAVKKSYSLPKINTDDDRELCIRMVNEAILETTHHTCGPVQLNIEALDSETWCLGDFELPIVRVIKRYQDEYNFNFSLNGKKIMVLIGEHIPFCQKEITAIENFCNTNNALVYKSHLSNYFGRYAINGLPVLAGASLSYFKDELSPDIVITLGGITGDYDVYYRIRNNLNESTEIWRVNPDGNIVDTYGRLTKVFQMSIETFFYAIGQSDNFVSHSYYESWEYALKQSHHEEVELPLSNMYVAQQLHDYIPQNSNIHFAILNSLRCWSIFDLHQNVKAYSNVGGFGIDGCLSTMLGQSFSTDELCFLIIGDLSFYYDMNALAIRHIKSNVRILLINNNGGAEFKINTIHEKIDVSRYIAGDNHFHNAKSWAEENRFQYIPCYSKEDFLENREYFVDRRCDKPILMEVFTNAEDDKNAIYTLRASCKCLSHSECVLKEKKGKKNKIITNIIGDTCFSLFKKVFK